MVEVFKTNVEHQAIAERIKSLLKTRFPFSKINFDLDDCDRILRVEDINICAETIIELVKQNGSTCELLN